MKQTSHPPISEVDLPDDVDEVEEFTHDVLDGVPVVLVVVEGEVGDKEALALCLGPLVHNGRLQLRHQHLDLASLSQLPQAPRDVEEDGLYHRESKRKKF